MVGSSGVSDHCSIWIMVNNLDWGPKPFNVLNVWFENINFFPFVEKEWSSLRVHGRSDFMLKEKLRLLKGSLRR